MANIKIAQLTNQTAISDNDLVIVESATSTNKMTVGNFRKLIAPTWKSISNSGVAIGGSKTLNAPEKFDEVMVVGANYNNAVFYRAVQSLDPPNSITKKIQQGNNTQVLLLAVQIIGDTQIYISVLPESDQGATRVFYR